MTGRVPYYRDLSFTSFTEIFVTTVLQRSWLQQYYRDHVYNSITDTGILDTIVLPRSWLQRFYRDLSYTSFRDLCHNSITEIFVTTVLQRSWLQQYFKIFSQDLQNFYFSWHRPIFYASRGFRFQFVILCIEWFGLQSHCIISCYRKD